MATLRTLVHLSATLLSTSTLVGCGEESDRPSEVHTTRVLAVRAETPFARPSTTVALSMLAHDGSPRAERNDGTKRGASILWVGGCSNPPGDHYGACMPYVSEVLSRLGSEHLANRSVPAEAPAGIVGWGESFTAEIPSDIVSSRSVAAGVVHPYGIQIVFFAYCGGTLRLRNTTKDFPLGCYDTETGKELGRDDFEYGFYPIFVYEDLSNENPTIAAARFSTAEGGATCSADTPCEEGQHCGAGGTCIPVVARCKAADEDDCESQTFHIEVPKSNVERSLVAHVTEEDAMSETLWVSYYANGGSFEEDARIINDPHSGWNTDIAGKWRANVSSSREVRLWAVVRDNRNGVAWTSQDVWVE